MTLQIAVMNETAAAERRVALTPDAIARLLKKQPEVAVQVESGAGAKAGFPDAMYEAVGAKVVKALGKVKADVLLRVTPPSAKEVLPLADNGTLVMLSAGADSWKTFAKGKRNVLALEKLPRTSRAQALDVLSSQANLAGYAAVLAATQHLPRLMPMMTTAAGSAKPAQVLVLGVGVAGLQAIATAKRLGAQVQAFDVRPEVAEQIRSLGAKPVELPMFSVQAEGGYAKALDAKAQKQLQEELAKVIAGMDIVVSTAQIPGKPAPVLITKEAVAAMKPASVIADLGAGGYNKANGVKGGNCPLTVADKVTATANGITLLGETNYPSQLAGDASRFWAANMVNLLALLVKDGAADFSDELVAAMRVVKEGKLV
ncbi:MAG: NAD(P) transhydrogenase subunit alpha [Pseudomonadaceae bacterium]|nr:NAD(P) transhydrogenase subunit alpha [Pseudomonadaceae bacterium]